MSKNYVTFSNRTLLSDSDILDIRASSNSVRTIAVEFNVPKSTIHDIRTGKTWSHVPNPKTAYKSYNIYPDGRIFSTKANKFLSPRIDRSGTVNVELTVNGSRKSYQVASLVAKAFLNTSKQVSYRDGDRTNVHFTNLMVR